MNKNILLYNSGGGLGDCIQIFDLVTSLKNNFNDYNFYYLGAHENHFDSLLKNYNIKINTLDLKIKLVCLIILSLMISLKSTELNIN